MVDTDRSRIDRAVEAIGSVKRYCLYDDCPHFLRFGRRRYIGYSVYGSAKHKCQSCRRWSIYEDEPQELELVAMAT